MAELSDAIGLGPSSIYNVFGNKLSLYERALQHYMDTHAALMTGAIATAQERGARDGLLRLCYGLVELFTDPGSPRGCAVFQGTSDSASAEGEAGPIAARFRAAIGRVFTEILRHHKPDEELAADRATLARLLTGSVTGLSQLAVDGTDRAQLRRVARCIVAACIVECAS